MEMNSSIRRPNFFIVGAPKCGTTSFYAWLSEHPQIFMSSPKEPNHFNVDLSFRRFPELNKYEALFESAKPEHIAIGEATTHYLYSSCALANILDYNPSARVIALVRNPIDAVVSFHTHRVYTEEENVEDFERAWRLQKCRAKGISVPPKSRTPEFLQYGPVYRLGEQVERLLKVVPRLQRHIVVLDDLKANPLTEWKAVLRFLGLEYDNRTHFPIYNPARRVRYKKLRTVIRPIARMKNALGLPRFRLSVLKRIDAIEQPNEPVSPGVRAELTEYFRDDINLLGQLLKRDFSSWLA